MADDLAQLEPFLAAYLNRLGPAQRRKVLRKIGEETRRLNAKRIADNVQPDGSAMAPRKKRKRMKDRKGRIRRTGKMFPKIRLARSLKVLPSQDQVEVGYGWNRFTNYIASIHQEGRTVPIGRIGANTGGGSTAGRKIYATYPERRLLGFGPEDLEAITDAALKMLEG